MFTTLMKAFLISVFLCLFSVANAHNGLSSITYYTEVYPPSNFIKNDQLTGLSVDILKLMWQQLSLPEQEILVVPWARGYRNTLQQPNTMLFTMARTEKREKLFKWVGPIYVAEHLLVAKKGFNQKVEKISQVHNKTVAAMKNDVSEITLLEYGFPEKNIVRITNLKQAVLMLQNGRVDLIIVSRSSLKSLLKENKLTLNDVEIAFSVNKVGNYFAFNRNTSDKVIQQFQQAFNALATQRARLLQQYGL